MATPTQSSTTTDNPPTRRAYKGSCHCGHIQYIAHLTLPPPLVVAIAPNASSTTRLRKCNCSTCHKMGLFHVRLMDAPNDFLLLSPLNPEQGGLTDYTCFARKNHFYFCPTCGVRCFAFSGESEVREVEIDGNKQQVWTPKRAGWNEPGTGYLSVNGITLEPGQEGLNLKEWHEKGWIQYLDMKNHELEDRLGEPHEGGIY